MIYYNWNSVVLHAKTDKRILEFFKEVCSSKPMQTYKTWVKQALLASKKQDSYLLNPLPLLAVRGVSDKEKVIYIGLASMRSYNRYVLYKEKYLDIRTVNNKVLLDEITNNPLLNVVDNNIYFKYEEN